MTDSGHTWSYPEDFAKAAKDLEASRSKVEQLNDRVFELEYQAIALKSKLEICKNALRTIKHTECDTYKVAARALADTKEVDKDGE